MKKRSQCLSFGLLVASSLLFINAQAQSPDTESQQKSVRPLTEQKTQEKIRRIPQARDLDAKSAKQHSQQNTEKKPKGEPKRDTKEESKREPERKPDQKNTQDLKSDREPRPPKDLEPKSKSKSKSKPKPKPKPKPEQKPNVPAKPRKPLIKRNGSLLNQSLPALPSQPVLTPAQKQQLLKSQKMAKAEFEPREIMLVSATMNAAKAVARQFRRYQLTIKSRQKLSSLGFVVSIFRAPESVDIQKRLKQIHADFPDLITDSNQRYQVLSQSRKTSSAKTSSPRISSRKTYARTLLDWPQDNHSKCLSDKIVRIGIIDTTVNAQHPALANTNLQVRSFIGNSPNGKNITSRTLGAKQNLADTLHGTAIASLIVGNTERFQGLLPKASLFAASVFRTQNKLTHTNTEYLLNALNWLLSEKVTVINLSLGGQQNRIFEHALQNVMNQGTLLVAAAGNQGPDTSPIYPAAQKGVIAVTAIDAAKRLYPQANQGSYIDFSAPGVDVWAADGQKDGHYHTGTSFAAPYVSAALALIKSKNNTNQRALEDLKEKALDLGPKGKDKEFGWGLISGLEVCQPRR